MKNSDEIPELYRYLPEERHAKFRAAHKELKAVSAEYRRVFHSFVFWNLFLAIVGTAGLLAGFFIPLLNAVFSVTSILVFTPLIIYLSQRMHSFQIQEVGGYLRSKQKTPQ